MSATRTQRSARRWAVFSTLAAAWTLFRAGMAAEGADVWGGWRWNLLVLSVNVVMSFLWWRDYCRETYRRPSRMTVTVDGETLAVPPGRSTLVITDGRARLVTAGSSGSTRRGETSDE